MATTEPQRGAPTPAAAPASGPGEGPEEGPEEGRGETTRVGHVGRATDRWFLAVLALAFVIRVAVGVVVADDPLVFDAREYVGVGMLLADGEGVVWPFRTLDDGSYPQTAYHPPVTYLWFGAASALGADSRLALQLGYALLGTATVAVVGLVARRLAGAAAGLVAALLVAVLPGFWGNEATLGAETPAQLAVAVVLLCAYRLRGAEVADRPGRFEVRAALLGGACAVALLTRTELVLLVPLLLLPAVVGGRGVTSRRKVTGLAVALLWLGAVVAPWLWWNDQRFVEPVGLTNGLGATFVQTNCHDTWFGDLVGYRSTWCSSGADSVLLGRPLDESQLAGEYQAIGLGYASRHLDRAPVVLAARLGRTFGVWDPLAQARVEAQWEGRNEAVVVAAGVTWLALVALGVVGLRRLRAAGVVVFPLLAPVAAAAAGSILAFGTSRFRSGAEVAVAVAAAVALAAWGDRRPVSPRRCG